jgi:hypothetical protein
MFLYFSVVSLSTVQIDPLRPSPSHSATNSQSFRISVNILSRSAVAGGGGPCFTGVQTRSRRPVYLSALRWSCRCTETCSCVSLNEHSHAPAST